MSFRENTFIPLLVAFAFAWPFQQAAAQGPLAPSGRPGKTMKSLLDLEPRTVITNLPFTISDSGSYYLMTNLTAGFTFADGISVEASNVTIDLMVFTLIGPGPTSGNPIFQHQDFRELVFKNGHIRNWQGAYRPHTRHKVCDLSLYGSIRFRGRQMEADGVKPKSDTVKVFVLDYGVLVLTNQSESRFPVEEAIRKPGRCGSAADTYAAGCADNTCPTARGGRMGCCAPSNSSYPSRRQEA